ncbi:MAG: helix-turn-helix transcriptional regulator, partial [Raoultibacter sp.]
MEIAFYIYTILFLLICIAAGVTALSAYFVSRKRRFILATFFFLFYFLDLAMIFQSEYLGQNLSYSPDLFYLIEYPFLKTLLTLGTLETFWLILCDELDVESRFLKIVPALIFVALSFLVLTLFPESQWQQWAYYSLRQVFFLGCLAYALFRYCTADPGAYKTRLRRFRFFFIVTVVLVVCVFAEDSFTILVWKPDFT